LSSGQCLDLNFDISFGVIYLSPNLSVEQLNEAVDEAQTYVNNALRRGDRVILVGDFNFDAQRSPNDSRTKLIVESWKSLGLASLHELLPKSTRAKASTHHLAGVPSGMLDYLCVEESYMKLYRSFKIHDMVDFGSDHHLISAQTEALPEISVNEFLGKQGQPNSTNKPLVTRWKTASLFKKRPSAEELALGAKQSNDMLLESALCGAMEKWIKVWIPHPEQEDGDLTMDIDDRAANVASTSANDFFQEAYASWMETLVETTDKIIPRAKETKAAAKRSSIALGWNSRTRAACRKRRRDWVKLQSCVQRKVAKSSDGRLSTEDEAEIASLWTQYRNTRNQSTKTLRDETKKLFDDDQMGWSQLYKENPRSFWRIVSSIAKHSLSCTKTAGNLMTTEGLSRIGMGACIVQDLITSRLGKTTSRDLGRKDSRIGLMTAKLC
jgi:hypothetical protein